MTKEAAPNEGTKVDPLEIRGRVFAEAERFRAKLPILLPIYGERWVVFRDDEVISDHATEEEAYVAGIERFGRDGGHVVAIVREPEIITIGAVATLGL